MNNDSDGSRVSQWVGTWSIDDKNMPVGQSLWYVTASALLRLRSLNCFESIDGELLKRKSGMGQHISANAHMPVSISWCRCSLARGLY